MDAFSAANHPGWCSTLSSDEGLPGTAAVVSSWVLLEFPGGWGRDILDGEALGADLAAALGAHLDAAGARLLFIRRPGREGQHDGARRVVLCDTRPGAGPARWTTVADPAGLLDLDLAPGAPVAGARPVGAPVALVCTHGRRDRCCAVRGRPVAAGLERIVGGPGPGASGVWECSHTGGHRFAPTLVLPETGYTYGSGDTADYARAVAAAAAGRVSLDGLRGRSTWTAAGQVAELAVRASGVDAGVDDLRVRVDGDRPDEPVVEHVDGRTWDVVVAADPIEPRPASCGAGPKPALRRRVVSLRRR